MSDLRKDVTIEKKIYDIIYERIQSKNNDFESVDGYLDFILNQILIEDEDNEEIKEVEDELKKLGYI
tara:strand:+ start:441 stop:641 length:201 start_codon:yes stop_codon:yes gene_type:complete